MIWELLAAPIFGALIGWITNVLAIKMLFWPRKPVRIPGLPFEWYGLLPKRQKDLARSIGETIDTDLLPIDEVIAMIDETGYKQHLVNSIVTHIDARIEEKLPKFIPSNLKTTIKDYVGELVRNESESLISGVTIEMLDKVRNDARLGDLVRSKIESFELDELEKLVINIANKELRHIEILGGVLGFLIGLIQSALLYWRLFLNA
ncbi:MAG: DUF445 family protein [Firmicutes bacterium]|nr:DUF445 family protein [Bacillota bacterium]